VKFVGLSRTVSEQKGAGKTDGQTPPSHNALDTINIGKVET